MSFASTIAELTQQQGRDSAAALNEQARIRAQALQSTAQAVGNAAAAKGQIWGNAISGIGQSIANIPAEINKSKTLDLQRQDIQAQVAERQAQAKKLQQQDVENQQVDRAFQESLKPDGTVDLQAFSSKIPGSKQAVYLPLIEKVNEAADKNKQLKDSTAAHAFFSAYKGGTPASLVTAAKMGATAGAMTPEDVQQIQQIAGAISSGPADAQEGSTKALAAHLGSHFPQFQDLLDADTQKQATVKKTLADAALAESNTNKPINVPANDTLVTPTGKVVYQPPKTAGKRTEAEQELDAYAKFIGKPSADDLTYPDRQKFEAKKNAIRSDAAFQQHMRERNYDVAHPTPEKSKSQDALEQEYRTVLARGLSSRSGGLGLEDAKVQQANHLTALLDQAYDPKTDTYNLPKVQQTELAMGLAKMLSPTGTVGIQLEKEINQRTAKGDLNAAITYITGTPMNGSTQDVVKMFKDSIQRQGAVAEQNREGEMAYLRGLAPTDLEEPRRQKLESTSLNPLRQSRVIRNTATGERKLQVSTDGGKTWK